MAYVTPLYGGSAAQVDYRLGLVYGCESDARFSYHTDAAERSLFWIGQGLEAFGVAEVYAGAELRADQFDMARRLIAGQHIGTGEQLVAPKLAVPADAKVALAPLVAAVNGVAAERGMAPERLLGAEAKLGRAWASATRAVARRGAAAVSRVDEAARLAEAAGLSPDQVWGADTVAAAVRNLVEVKPVLDANGQPARAADGTPKMATVQRRERVGIAGYDIGITVPKSLSVLLAFAPDDLVRGIEDAYVAACQRAFSWTESRTSYVKRGHHGGGQAARCERSSGFSGWVMTHRTARAVAGQAFGDPHWHVHITIGNLAQAGDGGWLTVAAGGRELMRHAAAIDKLTQAQIRASLSAEYGIEFARSARTRLWEVAHIPAETCALFSKRHTQVTRVLEALGHTNATATAKDARVLTRASRPAKSQTTPVADTTLRAAWRAQAVAAGHDPDAWLPAVLARYRAGERFAGAAANASMAARHGITVDALVAALTEPEHGLTAHRRRFSQLDALAAVADALPYGASVGEVEGLCDVVLAHPAFVALAADNGLAAGQEGQATQLAGSHLMAGGALYTTADVPDAERKILDTVAAAAPGQGRAVVAAEVLAMAVSVTETAQGYELSAEQRAALTAVVTNGRAVEAVVGPPGTGKTTLMRTARVAWQAQGYVVAGAATAAVAAQNLAAESGIESRTVAQWRHRIRAGAGLAGIDVLVLDEANLTSDRDRARLYQAARRSGTKIVEVGDPKQLRGVGVGSMFGYLHAALNGPVLTENRRQRSEDERAAIAAFRDGRYTQALSTWARTGGVRAHHSSSEGVAAMVSAYARQAEAAPDPHTLAAGLVMLAATNEATERINQATQAVRLAHGRLGPAATFSRGGGREISFHVGDQVLIRRNDRTGQAVAGEAVLNGYRGVVTAITPAGVRVGWRQPGDPPDQRPHTGVCSPAYIADGGLELGYCLTAHKAEGLTVAGSWTRADGTAHHGSVLVWTPGMDNPGLYVAATRDRGATILFGALEELESDRERLAYGTPPDQQALTDRVIAALAERAAATAENANDRPVLVDLGQAAHQPTDARLEPAQTPTPAQLVEPATASERARLAEAAKPIVVGELDETNVASATEPSQPAAPAMPAEAVQPLGELDELGQNVQPDGPLTEGHRQRWRELHGRISDAWLDEQPAELAAARAAWDAFVADIGPRRLAALEGEDDQRWAAYRAETSCSDDEPVQPVESAAASEAQRARWAELNAAVTTALADQGAESPAPAEARAAREEFTHQLGPERMAVLYAEQTERLRAQAAEREAARAAAHERWTNPHPRVRWTDRQLAAEIDAADLERRRELAAAQKTAERLAELEPQVIAGAGPAVRELDQRLAAWRRLAESRTQYEHAQQLLGDAELAERHANYEAYHKRQEAASLSWLRSGRKHQLEADVAALDEQAREAQAVAELWRAEMQRLGADLGQHRYSGDPAATVRRLQASYEADRAQAAQRDEAELAWMRQQIDYHHRQAERHGQGHDQLAEEKTTRDGMPAAQASLEATWRTQWQLEQYRRETEQAEREADEVSHRYLLDREMGLDHGHDHSQSYGHDHGHDHGLGFGL